MNTEKNEKEIRQLFSELRAEDSQRVPSFDAVTQAVPSGASTGRISFPWLQIALATTAIALLVGTIAIRLNRRSIERERRQWAALSTWEASTDALLHISSVPWESTVTTPSDFLINNPAVPSGTKPL